MELRRPIRKDFEVENIKKMDGLVEHNGGLNFSRSWVVRTTNRHQSNDSSQI